MDYFGLSLNVNDDFLLVFYGEILLKIFLSFDNILPIYSPF